MTPLSYPLTVHGNPPYVQDAAGRTVLHPDQFSDDVLREIVRYANAKKTAVDSRIATYEHISTVQTFMHRYIADLQRRLLSHDKSKLVSPEVEAFDEYTPRLAAMTYNSDEYKACLAAMKPALDHHYAHNPHHPEHWPNGIRDMSLTDLIEMLADWQAAVKRHTDGDIRRSIEVNQKRFGYSDELKQILLNSLVSV